MVKDWKSKGKDPMKDYTPLSQERMAEYDECIRKLEDPAAVLAQARSAMYPLTAPVAPAL